MASIQKQKAKNGTITFRVQLFINGIRGSKSGFESKAEAKLWSVKREAEIPSYPNPATGYTTAAPLKTLGDVFDRYAEEVSPKRAGHRWEKIRLKKLSNSPTGGVLLRDLGPENLAQWRDDRLKEVSGSTVRREMTLISHTLETARREWRWINFNPSRDVKKPQDASRNQMPSRFATLIVIRA